MNAVCYVCVRSVYGIVMFLGAMYMLAMVMSLKCFVCIFRSCISVLSVLMVCGVLMCVNVVHLFGVQTYATQTSNIHSTRL